MQKRYLATERLDAVAAAALIGGYGRIEQFRSGGLRRRVTLTLSGDCQRPYEAELHARHSATHGKRVKPRTVSIIARCRKCAMCLEHRSNFWAARAIEEWRTADRSFFGTITLSPENHFRQDTLAQVRLAQAGTDFWSLSDQERFDERVKQIGVEITKWLKRLRKGNPSHPSPQFRYLLIAEAHESERTSVEMRGRPHFHVMFHETDAKRPLVRPDEMLVNKQGLPVTDKYGNGFVADHGFLKSGWNLGFTRFQQAVTPMAAFYLCKYLTKATQARVRASGRYGGADRHESAVRQPERVSEGSTIDPPQGDRETVTNEVD